MNVPAFEPSLRRTGDLRSPRLANHVVGPAHDRVMLRRDPHRDGAGDADRRHADRLGVFSHVSSKPTKGSTPRVRGASSFHMAQRRHSPLALSVDVGLAGRRALGVFVSRAGPGRFVVSEPAARCRRRIRTVLAGWLLPGMALVGLLLSRGERRRIATKAASIATLTLVVRPRRASLDGFVRPRPRRALGALRGDARVLIGLGVSALENDLRQAGFGWRQVAAGLSVTALMVAAVPFAAIFASGRFDLPTTSVAESLSTLAPSSAGGYRVLWLGDPSVLPWPDGRWRPASPPRRR